MPSFHPTNKYVADPEVQARLQRYLEGPPHLLCVVGLQGVGKSRLMAECRRGDVGRAWIDARGITDSRHLLVALEGHPDAELIVFDGCDGFEDVGALRLEGRWVVVTRREPPADHPLLLVPPLPEKAAVQLLLARAEHVQAPVAHLDPPAVEQVAALLDGLPVSLEAAARHLEIASAPSLAADLAADGIVAQRLRAPWAQTWGATSPDVRRRLTSLSVFQGGFDLAAVAALWDMDEPATAETLAPLRRVGLVRPVAGHPGRFELPFGVAAMIHRQGSVQERAHWWRRHASYYAHEGGPEDWTGLPLRWAPAPPLEEQRNFAAVCRPERANLPLLAARAAIALGIQARKTGDIDEAVQCLQDVVDPLDAPTQLPDVWQLRVHYLIGFLHVISGDAHVAAAHLQRAHRLMQPGYEPSHPLLRLQKALAWAHWRRGAPDEALASADEGANMARRAQNGAHLIDFLGFKAMVHSEAGQFAARAGCLVELDDQAQTAEERSLRDVWHDVVARHDDEPVRISPEATNLHPRVILTTTLGKCVSLLWLGRTSEIQALMDRQLSDLPEPRLARTREALRAGMAVVNEHPPSDTEALDALLYDLDTQGCREGTVGYRLIRAGLFWRRGSIVLAAQQFAAALIDADHCGLHVLRDEFRIVLAVCDHRASGHGATALANLEGQQPMQWYAALHRQATAMLKPGSITDEAPVHRRWSMQLLHRVATDSRSTAHPHTDRVEIIVAPDFAMFSIGPMRVDLHRKGTAQRFVRALVTQHQEEAGSVLGRDHAVEAVWPGERMLGESSAARLYTLVWQLRRLGLAGVLLTTPTGYALRHDVVVRTGTPNV